MSPTPRRIGSSFGRGLGIAAVLLLAATAAVAVLFAWAIHDLPLEADYEHDPTIILEAANGEPLGYHGPLRLPDVPRSGFPDHLVKAVLAIEDRRFYAHWGLDTRAVLRATWRNLAAGKIVEGGSTITQQLAKRIIDDEERSFRRKAREALVAIRLEFRLSKDEILERYLNGIYMGAGAYGIPAAARAYFSKDVDELTLAESAVLAGLIRSPSHLSPLRNLAAAHERASVVLQAMVESGFISDEVAQQAVAAPANPAPLSIQSEGGGWFADWIAREAIDFAGPSQRSLRVRTTVIPAVQELAERIVREELDAGRSSGISQAALVALAPDGAVLAMVGGHDYSASQFNRAVQALRQPGSAFKPFVYLAALRKGYSPDDVIEDAPVEVDGWQPENFGGNYQGRVTLREAFTRSLNTAAVRLAQQVGIRDVVDAARDLGIDAQLTETPSLALGASEVTLLDLTGAYASIRAGMAPIEPWGIAGFGAAGNAQLVSTGPSLAERRSLGRHHNDMVALLRDVVVRGTGRAAALPEFAAGKTGTSQNFRDAWFIGFNEVMVAGVWVGNDDGTPMDGITGGSVPSAIWRRFMTEAGPLLDSGDTGRPDAVAALSSDQPAANQCEYRACAEKYRSFRASDCSYQPYGGGPRSLCTLSSPEEPDAAVEVARASDAAESEADQAVEVARASDAAESEADQNAMSCDVEACTAAYDSFRASDCTYQPYSGPRRLCTMARSDPGDAGPDPEPTAPTESANAEVEASVPAPMAGCDVAACAERYSSFRESDCTYQPFEGPRRACTMAENTGQTIATDLQHQSETQTENAPRQPQRLFGIRISDARKNSDSGCNIDACAAKYSSFDPATCTYQPYGPGPRRTCEE